MSVKKIQNFLTHLHAPSCRGYKLWQQPNRFVYIHMKDKFLNQNSLDVKMYTGIPWASAYWSITRLVKFHLGLRAMRAVHFASRQRTSERGIVSSQTVAYNTCGSCYLFKYTFVG